MGAPGVAQRSILDVNVRSDPTQAGCHRQHEIGGHSPPCHDEAMDDSLLDPVAPLEPEARRRVLAGVTESHRRLFADIDGLTDAQARAASNLPDWTVGHVLTHIARNADSF